MVYRYKATIPGNKIFMREYEVKDSFSLYAFHTFLLNDLGFSPDQMVMFRTLQNGKVKKELGLFDFGDGTMDSVFLNNLVNEDIHTLEYVYDMYKDRSLTLNFISSDEELPKRSYPRLVAEKGKNPDQFSDNYDDFEHLLDVSDPDLEEQLPGEA